MSIIGQYENLSDALLQGDLVVKVPVRMQWLRLFSIVGIPSAKYITAQAVNQGDSALPLENAAFVTSGGTGGTDLSLTTIPQATFDLGMVSTGFEMTYAVEDVIDSPEEPTKLEEKIARVRIFQQLSQVVGKTSATGGEPPTLNELCADSRRVDVDATTQLDLELEMLDDAIGRISANEGICTFAMMTTETLNTLYRAYYERQLTPKPMPVHFPGIGNVPVPSHNGVPILINDEIQSYTTAEVHTSSRVYFCTTRTNAINPDECLTMFTKQKFLPNLVRTRRTNAIAAGSTTFRIEVNMPIGVALPCDGALSILEGFKLYTPPWAPVP